jgi:hypothetical protein
MQFSGDKPKSRQDGGATKGNVKDRSRSLVGRLPATSWPLPQARLAVDVGGPDYGLARDDKFRTQAGAAKMAALRKATSKTEVGPSSANLPATSWPLPQARLAVDLGGPDYGLARDDNGRMRYG